MKKQISITQFTVAVDNPIVLHNGKSNVRPISPASYSVNLSNNDFEKPYQPNQAYCFPKRLFEKKTTISISLTAYKVFVFRVILDRISRIWTEYGPE